jgi:uncharacterized protein YeaO (DUF488 family)
LCKNKYCQEAAQREVKKMENKLQLKRVYDRSTKGDGTRFFVERLWPRGLRTSVMTDAEWLRDVAPSAELRKWFHHDPERWNEFRRRYFAELKHNSDVLSPILEAAHNGTVTLLYSSHDTEHNNAVALKEFLRHKLHPVDPACLCLQ